MVLASVLPVLLYYRKREYRVMGWIKSPLPDKWHSKLKHYRDDNNHDNLSQAACAIIQRGLLNYESQNGQLPEEYND
jgi:hypothetical protein